MLLVFAPRVRRRRSQIEQTRSATSTWPSRSRRCGRCCSSTSSGCAARSARTARRRSAPAPSRRSTTSRRPLRDHGGGTLSWMTTWGGNSYARTSDGIVAYQKRAGVAIVLADPLGPDGIPCDIGARVHHDGRARGPDPVLLQRERCDEGCRARRPGAASWSPTTRSSTCRAWSSPARPGPPCARRSIAPAREEVTFRMTRLADEPWGIAAAAAGDLGDVGRRQGAARDGIHPRHARRGGGPRGAARAGGLAEGRRRRIPVVAAGLRRRRDACAAGRST